MLTRINDIENFLSSTLVAKGIRRRSAKTITCPIGLVKMANPKNTPEHEIVNKLDFSLK
jgi:hypothetical protein